MNRIKDAVKENPVEAAMVSTGIVLGLALGLLTMLGWSDVDIAIGVSLEILAIIAIMLFFILGRTSEVKQSTVETTRHLQNLEGCLEEIRLRPWRLAEVFDSFGQKLPELEADLKHADQVWILTRTCRRLWSDFEDQLVPLIERDKMRLLLLDPNGHALRMAYMSAFWERDEGGQNPGSNVGGFLGWLEASSQASGWRRFVRKIDYLPAWTLILVNPGSESGISNDGKIYVELATYRAHPRKRPCFTVFSDQDLDLFSEFCDEYRKMWDKAIPAW
jgi:hypothetical protein